MENRTQRIKLFDRHLPPEIITDILLRLPLKALVRLEVVCKHWQQVIKSLSFRQLYSDYHKDNPNSADEEDISNYIFKGKDGSNDTLYYFELNRDYLISDPVLNIRMPVTPFVDLYGLRFDFIGSFNGFICLYKNYPRKGNRVAAIVYNPVTRESIDVSLKSVIGFPCEHLGCGFGYVSSTNQYKLVTIYRLLDEPDFTCVDVYVVGGAQRWIHVGMFRLGFVLVTREYFNRHVGVFWKNKLHWRNVGDGSVVVFDLETMKFNAHISPPLMDQSCYDEDGVLGFIGVSISGEYFYYAAYRDDDFFDVWILNMDSSLNWVWSMVDIQDQIQPFALTVGGRYLWYRQGSFHLFENNIWTRFAGGEDEVNDEVFQHNHSVISFRSLGETYVSTIGEAGLDWESLECAPAVPVPKKINFEIAMFGDVRVDSYYWLRDMRNPEFLEYVSEERYYGHLIMKETEDMESQLLSEIRSRTIEDCITAPTRKGSYYYYRRILKLEGKGHVQYCRRLIGDIGERATVHDTMPIGPNDPQEHVILDHNYNGVGAFKVSPNHKRVAYAEGTEGSDIYTVYVIDAESKALVGKPLVGVTSYLEWAGDDTLAYVAVDETLRPDKVCLHRLGSDQSKDTCMYHEKDEMFSVDLQLSESNRYLFVASKSTITRFIFYFDIFKQQDGLVVLTPRLNGIETSVSHRGSHFFIKRRSDEIFNSELLVCPVGNTSATTLLLPHRESVKIEKIQLFVDNLVVFERENGLQKVTIFGLPNEGQPIEPLSGGRPVEFIDPVCSVEPSEAEFMSSILRFSYSSLRTPESVYDYDMSTGVSVLKKIDTVLGGFDTSNYVTERKWAISSDGTQVPMSIVYHKDLVKLDGTNPLLLYGYGAYEVCVDPYFKASRLSLLDRGFIYVIAHIRGGGEMGRQWYEEGKVMKKMNTFTDFIACAEYLIENKYCTKEKLCIYGWGAGGLLMGVVLNMRPDLFKAAVASDPFVDVVTRMLNTAVPISEYEEWGDPGIEGYYHYMKSYSPMDNIKAQNYPNILVTVSDDSTRFTYSEPLKFVAKLREMKSDLNTLIFKISRFSSKPGRLEKLRDESDDAFFFTFILKSLNMIPPAPELQ